MAFLITETASPSELTFDTRIGAFSLERFNVSWKHNMICLARMFVVRTCLVVAFLSTVVALSVVLLGFRTFYCCVSHAMEHWSRKTYLERSDRLGHSWKWLANQIGSA